MTEIKSYNVRRSSAGRLCVYYKCESCNESLKLPLRSAGQTCLCPICDWDHIVPGKEEKLKLMAMASELMDEKPVRVDMPKPKNKRRVTQAEDPFLPTSDRPAVPAKPKRRLIDSEGSANHFSENSRTIGMAVIIQEATGTETSTDTAKKRQYARRQLRKAYPGCKRLAAWVSVVAGLGTMAASIPSWMHFDHETKFNAWEIMARPGSDLLNAIYANSGTWSGTLTFGDMLTVFAPTAFCMACLVCLAGGIISLFSTHIWTLLAGHALALASIAMFIVGLTFIQSGLSNVLPMDNLHIGVYIGIGATAIGLLAGFADYYIMKNKALEAKKR